MNRWLPYAGRKVLVTGATGFVGACLTRRLVEHSADVHILTRPSSNRWRIRDLMSNLYVYEVDLRDAGPLKAILTRIRPEVTFHCATYGGLPVQQDATQIMETNVFGTWNLLAGLASVGCGCLIQMGSSSEYGLKSHPMREDDSLEPVSVYGASKAATSLLCQAMAHQGNFPAVTLRLFSPFGYYEEPTRLVPYVIDRCLRGLEPALTDGTAVRDFTFVEDVIDACLLVGSRNPICSGVFNVATGMQHSVRDIVDKIVVLSGARVTPKWGVLPPRPLEPTTWVADISKVKQVFGWFPKYTVDEGLHLTIEWHRRRLALNS